MPKSFFQERQEAKKKDEPTEKGVSEMLDATREWLKKSQARTIELDIKKKYHYKVFEIRDILISLGMSWEEAEKKAKKILGPYDKDKDYTKVDARELLSKETDKEKKPEPPKDTRKLRAMLSELYDDLRHDMTEAEQYKYNRLHRDEKFESLYEFMLDVKERVRLAHIKKEEEEQHRRKKEAEEWEESKKKADIKKAEDAARVRKEIDALLKSLPKEAPIVKAVGKKGSPKKRTMMTKAVVARKEMPHDSHKGRWTKEELYHFYNEHKYIPPFKNGNPRKVTIEQLNAYMRKPAWKRKPKGKANEHFKKVKSTVSEDNLFYA